MFTDYPSCLPGVIPWDFWTEIKRLAASDVIVFRLLAGGESPAAAASGVSGGTLDASSRGRRIMSTILLTFVHLKKKLQPF